MNLGGGLMGSMPLPGSTVARKSVDAVPDQFPAGLRVLVVDDDPTCLIMLEKMLRTCRYEVTKCNRSEIALNILRENKSGFDIVISDVHMPDMDGFKLLEHIGLEMDLPVIMMSADHSKGVVMKGVTHGACDYLIKPVRIEALKTIWQHVVRKKKNEFKDIEQSGSLDDGDRQHKQDESEYSSPANEGNWQSAKKKADEEESEDNNDTATLKKPRVVWSVELHQQFVAAVSLLGIDKAVPKKILELMNVPGLTRENVASHLQKYRLYLRRLSGVSHQSGLNNSFMGSTVARKSVDAVPDQFPAGLHVLVVADDPTCLIILEKMLRTCLYEVTKCNRAEIALNILRENKSGFDIVISDVHMPDMDGFKLLDLIGLEMDLPVIMMSADDSKSVVMKGVTHGACDYLIKPVRIEALKTIWQHVVRKKKNEFKDIEQSGSLDDGDRQHKQDESEYSSPANEGNWQSAKRKADEEESEDNNDTATLKKPRVVWSVELHQQFVAAVHQLGIDKAVPKKILELMNVPGLTRENVASHLQKYRLYLRRLNGVSHQSGLNNSFMSAQDSGYGAISSLGGIDYQALAVTGRLPAQTLAAYQAGIGRSTVKPGISMPFVDQRNLFSFETSKLRYGEGQQQQHSNADKQMNMLHGIPTTMEPKQLASLHQPTQPLGGLNAPTSGHGGQSGCYFMHMVQSQPRGQLLNESMGSQASGMHSPIGQTLPSSGASVGILPINGMVERAHGLAYNPVTQSSSSVVGFSVNNLTDLPSNSFPIGSTPGMSPLTSEGGLVQSEIKSDMKGSRGFAPSYDIFNDLQQHRTQDYQLQNSSLTYGASQQATALQNNVDVSPSILVQQGFSSGQRNEQNGSTFMGKTMFSTGLEHQRGISPSMDQTLNGLMVDSSSRVKTEDVQDIISSRSNLFQEQYGEDDLMSAILKQQSDLGTVGGDFDLDGYSLGNFPVNEVFTSQ